jgi:hypothetical protein
MEMNRLHPREMLLLAIVLLALLAFFYRRHQIEAYQTLQVEARKSLAELQEITDLKRIWNTQGIPAKLRRLKGLVPAASLKVFSVERHKVHLRAEGLAGAQLNRLLNRIGSLPVEILDLKIDRQKERYTLECRCKW